MKSSKSVKVKTASQKLGRKLGKEKATGILQQEHQILCDMLEYSTYDSQAMAYALLRIAMSGKRPALISKIMVKLYAEIKPVYDSRDGTGIKEGIDFESDVAPVREWFALLQGINL